LPKQPSLPTNTVPVPLDQRKGFWFAHPYKESSCGEAADLHMSWGDWVKYAHALNLEIAKRMREYGGPAEQDEPPPGGTPVLMRMAA